MTFRVERQLSGPSMAARGTHIVRGTDDVKDGINQVENTVVVPQGGSEDSAAGGSSAEIELRWAVESMSDNLPFDTIHIQRLR